MANFDKNHSREEIFSKVVRAGKRTYFFDVKATRANDYYLTITESKKRFNEGDEKPYYEKHKLFLYKEDFDKFVDGLRESVQYIRDTKGTESSSHDSDPSYNSEPVQETVKPEEETETVSDIKFEDLGSGESSSDGI